MVSSLAALYDQMWGEMVTVKGQRSERVYRCGKFSLSLCLISLEALVATASHR
jgi:hypothetical protein